MTRKPAVKRRQAQAGFTLVELLVVVAIISILAAIVGVNVLQALGDASQAQAKAQIRSFKTALMSYRISFKKFPSSSEGLQALVNNEKNKNFLEESTIPKDPWGNDYVYTLEGSRDYTIISYGEDGRAGGTEMDADISSASLSDDE